MLSQQLYESKSFICEIYCELFTLLDSIVYFDFVWFCLICEADLIPIYVTRHSSNKHMLVVSLIFLHSLLVIALFELNILSQISIVVEHFHGFSVCKRRERE